MRRVAKSDNERAREIWQGVERAAQGTPHWVRKDVERAAEEAVKKASAVKSQPFGPRVR